MSCGRKRWSINISPTHEYLSISNIGCAILFLFCSVISISSPLSMLSSIFYISLAIPYCLSCLFYNFFGAFYYHIFLGTFITSYLSFPKYPFISPNLYLSLSILSSPLIRFRWRPCCYKFILSVSFFFFFYSSRERIKDISFLSQECDLEGRQLSLN